MTDRVAVVGRLRREEVSIKKAEEVKGERDPAKVVVVGITISLIAREEVVITTSLTAKVVVVDITISPIARVEKEEEEVVTMAINPVGKKAAVEVGFTISPIAKVVVAVDSTTRKGNKEKARKELAKGAKAMARTEAGRPVEEAAVVFTLSNSKILVIPVAVDFMLNKVLVAAAVSILNKALAVAVFILSRAQEVAGSTVSRARLPGAFMHSNNRKIRQVEDFMPNSNSKTRGEVAFMVSRVREEAFTHNKGEEVAFMTKAVVEVFMHRAAVEDLGSVVVQPIGRPHRRVGRKVKGSNLGSTTFKTCRLSLI
mmetsp:Transcript_68102/g.107141  ORF Transcript_68102/g.107141 Transcript_68102/m.107141 type:complete len:312 (+) Transcript_68102:490-1425(+)